MKPAIVSISIAGMFLGTGCTTAQAMPQDLANETQKIVNEVKAQDNSVFEEIQRNTDMVKRLKSDIEMSKKASKQKLLNSVVDEFEKVTES